MVDAMIQAKHRLIREDRQRQVTNAAHNPPETWSPANSCTWLWRRLRHSCCYTAPHLGSILSAWCIAGALCLCWTHTGPVMGMERGRTNERGKYNSGKCMRRNGVRYHCARHWIKINTIHTHTHTYALYPIFWSSCCLLSGRNAPETKLKALGE